MNRDETIKALCEAGISKEKAIKADLVMANLRGVDLRGAYLEGADFRVAALIGADLKGANLSMADLEGADLKGANLRAVNLEGACLVGTDLRGADLGGADLRGANLRTAYLEGANLEGVDLRGAKGICMSHDCTAELLKRGACGNIRLLSFAGIVLLKKEWSCDDFVKLAHSDFSDVLELVKGILFTDPAWGYEDKYTPRD